MSGLFRHRQFSGFGSSAFAPPDWKPLLQGISGGRADRLRARVRERCPRQPGVYGMIDPRGRLIYVGKAKCLRTRLLSYFRKESRHPKAGRIIAQARAIVWEYAPSEFAALLRELELIRRFRPAFNVLGVPGRFRPVYLCLGRKPAPTLFLSRQPPSDLLAIYGPFVSGRFLGDAARRLNDLFQLRDCERSQTMHFADQPELFPVLRPPGCLRLEIQTCSGPCAGAVSRAGYARQVRAVRAFLDGGDETLMPRLEQDMRAASAAMAFEAAAALRDKINLLRWLEQRLTWLRQARREHTFVYSARDELSGQCLWYLIRGGQVIRVLPAPTDAASRRAMRATLEAIFLAPLSRLMIPADQIDSILLVTHWFRKHPEERGRLIPAVVAIDQCSASAHALIRQ